MKTRKYLKFNFIALSQNNPGRNLSYFIIVNKANYEKAPGK
jgi:hypothetical protein